ncbi:MAG: hypothetical protein Q4C66_02495 [Lachnospiraceae bacterium]|nr:hypothetical protein [Lachnospiraceae bacterium]
MNGFKHVNWITNVLLAAAILSLAASCRSYAVVRIDRVNVKFISDAYDFSGLPQIEAIARSPAQYQVDLCESAEVYYELNSDGPYENFNDPYDALYDASYGDPKDIYVVELSTAAGYQFRFSALDKNKITLSGMGAVLLRARQEDNGHTLRLVVQLDHLDAYTGQIAESTWNGCRGQWSESRYAVGYRLRLSDPKGTYHYAETAGTSYDFAPLMLTAGTYRYQIRAISKNGKYGEWVSGGSCIVTNETAGANRERYEVKKVNDKIDESLAHTPDNNRVEYLNTGWQMTPEGEYWYRSHDGTYPQDIWQLIDGSWYYFWGSGFMAHDAYVTWKDRDYYLTSDGQMLTNALAPDGRQADELGILSPDKTQN